MRKRQLVREIARLKDENQRLRRVAEAQASSSIRANTDLAVMETKVHSWRNIARAFYQVESQADLEEVTSLYEQAVRGD